MILAVFRLAAYVLISCAGLLVQGVALRLSPARAVRIPLLYHRLCLRLFGIRVEVAGHRCPATPCLYLSNHSSYLDIPVLGSLIPACFVAKSEVAGWPFFGWLARLQRTLFMDRRPARVVEGQTALLQRLRERDSMILFPEGTSSDGVRVLPFRRALFQPLLDQGATFGLVVQPVTVLCVAMNGLPADRNDRQGYAWFGDMDLLPHLWRFVQNRSCTVRVTFHAPINPGDMPDRKVFADTVECVVAGVPPARDLLFP